MSAPSPGPSSSRSTAPPALLGAEHQVDAGVPLVGGLHHRDVVQIVAVHIASGPRLHDRAVQAGAEADAVRGRRRVHVHGARGLVRAEHHEGVGATHVGHPVAAEDEVVEAVAVHIASGAPDERIVRLVDLAEHQQRDPIAGRVQVDRIDHIVIVAGRVVVVPGRVVVVIPGRVVVIAGRVVVVAGGVVVVVRGDVRRAAAGQEEQQQHGECLGANQSQHGVVSRSAQGTVCRARWQGSFTARPGPPQRTTVARLGGSV